MGLLLCIELPCAVSMLVIHSSELTHILPIILYLRNSCHLCLSCHRAFARPHPFGNLYQFRIVAMAHQPAQVGGTWTPYPALISTLPKSDQQSPLEEAACAHYCGRYADATSIFNNRLPPSHSSLLLALQRADMLTTQGCEPERVTLLKDTIASTGGTISGSERLLLELMLADAEYWTRGKTKPLARCISIVHHSLHEKDLQSLSDVEVRL